MADGYQRKPCSVCGEGLGFTESDPCERCEDKELEAVREALEIVQGIYLENCAAGSYLLCDKCALLERVFSRLAEREAAFYVNVKDYKPMTIEAARSLVEQLFG
jgi:hypothetical protein